MTGPRHDDRPLNIRMLLGFGLDGDGEHKRVTRAPNFLLFGGTKETHELLQQTALKFNEKVDERGKALPEINARELSEITHELREDL